MAPRVEETMDVRAAPVQPVGNGTNATAGLSVLVPVLALVLVVGAAWAGGDQPRRSLGDPGASFGAGLPGGDAPADAGGPTFPSHAYDRRVMTGQELEAARASGQVGRELVAVSGLLHNDPLALTCPAIRITFSRTFCRRLMAIFPASPGPAIPGAGPAIPGGGPTPPPPLMAQVLPGAPVPAILPSGSDLAPWLTGAIPIVVLGHFDDARAPACGIGREWCGDDFVVERVAWLDGAWLPLVPARDPAIPAADTPDHGQRAQEIVRRANARAEQVLSLSIVGSRLLAIVDPRAAAVAGPDRAGTLWYVRSFVPPRPAVPAEVGWAVIDDASGQVLGYSLAQP